MIKYIKINTKLILIQGKQKNHLQGIEKEFNDVG